MQRGKITYRERARQIIDFSGLKYQNITPTDIDGFLDFGNVAFVDFELKYDGAPVSYGQRLALERRCDSAQRAGIKSLCVICDHFVEDASEDVNAAHAIVREYRSRYKWIKPKSKVTLRGLIDRFRDYAKVPNA